MHSVRKRGSGSPQKNFEPHPFQSQETPFLKLRNAVFKQRMLLCVRPENLFVELKLRLTSLLCFNSVIIIDV